MNNKYIEMFIDIEKKKNFKYAVDYMGTYFLGLLDNVNYYTFLEEYYNEFIDFTNWLAEATDPILWESTYGDNTPMLYKLVDVIQDTNEQPDSLDEALVNSYNAIKDKEVLYRIAENLLKHKKQIIMSVDVFEADKPLYNFVVKFTKVEQKNNAEEVKKLMVKAFSLVVVYGGLITFTLREKGKENIYAFEGYDGNSIRSLDEEEMEDIFEDYILAKKDIEVSFNSYIINKEQLS